MARPSSVGAAFPVSLQSSQHTPGLDDHQGTGILALVPLCHPIVSGKPRRLIVLVYAGAVVLLLASWALGFTLVFGDEPAAAVTG